MLHRIRAARFLAAALIVIALIGVAGCTGSEVDAQEPERLVLASTTSTQDSGLFDEILPVFGEAHPECQVEVVAVGTGEALELGRRKDADVLLVHAKAAEEEFVAEGYGTERRDVMYNDFVIVGPEDDPASIADAADAEDAFSAIAASRATGFASRGDDSGTHKREMSIWDASGAEPTGEWYLSVGQGMGDTLRLASEKSAYTLVDRATFLALEDDVELVLLFEEDELLYNQYGVIVVRDATNADGAQAFADWITGPEAQGIIGKFGYETFGRALFVPNAEG